MKVLRRGHFRLVTLLSVAGLVLLYVYYHISTTDDAGSSTLGEGHQSAGGRGGDVGLSAPAPAGAKQGDDVSQKQHNYFR